MKIIIVTQPSSRRGGVAQLYANLKDYFTSNVEFFIIGSRVDNENLWTVLRRMFSDMWHFHLLLTRNDTDIVHVNPSLYPQATIRDGMLLLIAKLHGVSTIVLFHGWDEKVERSIRRRFKWLFRSVYGGADVFMALGQRFAGSLKDLGVHCPVFVVTTAVDQKFSDAFDVADVPINFSDELFRILYLARIEKDKGVYETLDTYRLLIAKYPFVRLIMAGDGGELHALKDYAERNGISGVEFPGFVRGLEKYKLFAQADVYLLPSFHEGLPISLLEAFAAGLPVITRPVGSIPEVFVSGENGFLTESHRPEELARLVEALILDGELRKRMSARNRHLGANKFSASKVAGVFDSIYTEVTRQGRGRPGFSGSGEKR